MIGTAQATTATAAVCAATLGLGCPGAVAGSTAAVAGVTTAAGVFIPNPPTTSLAVPNAFKVVEPKTDRWLDVYGTVFSPQTADGGHIAGAKKAKAKVKHPPIKKKFSTTKKKASTPRRVHKGKSGG